MVKPRFCPTCGHLEHPYDGYCPVCNTSLEDFCRQLEKCKDAPIIEVDNTRYCGGCGGKSIS